MTDDGSGAGLRIPSVLIQKEDGAILIDFMKTATKKELESVILLSNFNMSRPDNRVEYDLWCTSSNEVMLDFIQDFA